MIYTTGCILLFSGLHPSYLTLSDMNHLKPRFFDGNTTILSTLEKVRYITASQE